MSSTFTLFKKLLIVSSLLVIFIQQVSSDQSDDDLALAENAGNHPKGRPNVRDVFLQKGMKGTQPQTSPDNTPQTPFIPASLQSQNEMSPSGNTIPSNLNGTPNQHPPKQQSQVPPGPPYPPKGDTLPVGNVGTPPNSNTQQLTPQEKQQNTGLPPPQSQIMGAPPNSNIYPFSPQTKPQNQGMKPPAVNNFLVGGGNSLGQNNPPVQQNMGLPSNHPQNQGLSPPAAGNNNFPPYPPVQPQQQNMALPSNHPQNQGMKNPAVNNDFPTQNNPPSLQQNMRIPPNPSQNQGLPPPSRMPQNSNPLLGGGRPLGQNNQQSTPQLQQQQKMGVPPGQNSLNPQTKPQQPSLNSQAPYPPIQSQQQNQALPSNHPQNQGLSPPAGGNNNFPPKPQVQPQQQNMASPSNHPQNQGLSPSAGGNNNFPPKPPVQPQQQNMALPPNHPQNQGLKNPAVNNNFPLGGGNSLGQNNPPPAQQNMGLQSNPSQNQGLSPPAGGNNNFPPYPPQQQNMALPPNHPQNEGVKPLAVNNNFPGQNNLPVQQSMGLPPNPSQNQGLTPSSRMPQNSNPLLGAGQPLGQNNQQITPQLQQHQNMGVPPGQNSLNPQTKPQQPSLNSQAPFPPIQSQQQNMALPPNHPQNQGLSPPAGGNNNFPLGGFRPSPNIQDVTPQVQQKNMGQSQGTPPASRMPQTINNLQNGNPSPQKQISLGSPSQSIMTPAGSNNWPLNGSLQPKQSLPPFSPQVTPMQNPNTQQSPQFDNPMYQQVQGESVVVEPLWKALLLGETIETQPLQPPQAPLMQNPNTLPNPSLQQTQQYENEQVEMVPLWKALSMGRSHMAPAPNAMPQQQFIPQQQIAPQQQFSQQQQPQTSPQMQQPQTLQQMQQVSPQQNMGQQQQGYTLTWQPSLMSRLLG